MIKKLSRYSGSIFLLSTFVFTVIFSLFKFYFKLTLIIHGMVAITSAIIFLTTSRGKFNFSEVWKGKSQSYNSTFRIGFSVLAVLIFLLTFGLARTSTNIQFDSTEKNAFTLSEQTKDLLNKISGKIKARYFVRGSNLLKTDLDLLNRYHQYFSGFSYTQHDLDKERPLSESLGIKEINSLHLSLIDDEANSVIVSDTLTEEKVTNALAKLSRKSKPIIYFSLKHGEGEIGDNLEGGFSLLKDSLIGDGFLVNEIDINSVSEIPILNSVLIMLCPVRNLVDSELKKISEFIEKGGSLILFTEPRIKINLHELLEKEGFQIGNDTIVGVEKFTTGKTALGVQPVISNYASHQALKNFDKSIIVSAAVSVKKKANADEITELAFSDSETWAETDLGSLYSSDPKAVRGPDDVAGPVSFVAVKAKHRISKESRIVVVGDLDFAANVNLFQLFNRDFILNLVNWSAGDEEFVSIRAETLRKSKKMITETQFANIFIWMAVILPEIVLLIGLISLHNRKVS